MLRYLNFEPRFKLRWCRARDLFGSQEGLNCESLAYEVITLARSSSISI